MPVPVGSLKMTGAPVAMILTQAGTIDFVKIISIKGRYFRCKYGVYLLNLRRKITFEDTNLFVYDSKIPVPLSVEACRRIQEYLITNNKYSLLRNVVALNQTEYTKILGKSTMRFLGEMQRTDKSTILNLMNNALQSDRKLPVSPSLGESATAFADIFSAFKAGTNAKNLVFVFVDNIALKIKPLRLERVGDKLVGKFKLSGTEFEIDLTYKRNRYTVGKTSIYMACLDTQTKDVKDFEVPIIDYGSPEEGEETPETESADDQQEEEPEPVETPQEAEQVTEPAPDQEAVPEQAEEQQEPEEQEEQPEAPPPQVVVAEATAVEPVEEEPENVLVITDDDRKSKNKKKEKEKKKAPEPEPKKESHKSVEEAVASRDNRAIATAIEKKPRFGFGHKPSNGNKKPRKEDYDLPSNMLPQNLGMPITLNMESMLQEFVRLDPSMMEEAYNEAKFAKRAVDSVSPPPRKKSINIWFFVGIVIIGIIGYQAVGNPLISKWQTQTQLEEQQRRQDAAAKAAAEQAAKNPPPTNEQQPPVGSTNPPPTNNTSSEGGNEDWRCPTGWKYDLTNKQCVPPIPA